MLGGLVLGEMPSLPLTPLPPALPWRLGGDAVSVPPAPGGDPQYPNGTYSRGLSCRSFCHCAQDTASLWQFGHLALLQSTFPPLPIPGKAPEGLLHPALSHKNTRYWGSQQFPGGSRQPPTRKHPPFFLHRSLVLEFSHCTMSLAVGGSATYRDAPREQTFHTSIS